MGYTHYWSKSEGVEELDKEALKKALLLMAKIVEDNKAILADGNGENEPLANEKEVWFNGKDEQSHETFAIDVDWDGDFQFCKTAGKEYDKVVVACLLALKFYMGKDVDIKSDGIFTNYYGNTVVDPKLVSACEFALKYFPQGVPEQLIISFKAD